MNNPMGPKKTTRAARVLFALLTGFFLIPTLHAQPAAQNIDNRFLFIFDTSADMKKRVPALQKALNTMLATSVNGQLHSGDSIGVWTFDEDLQTGQFPLQHWDSDNAAMIASNITKFVEKQHYSKKTSFDALQPLLNQVVENSERLTVLIFCDGEAAISGTRFDNGINPRVLDPLKQKIALCRRVVSGSELSILEHLRPRGGALPALAVA